MAKITLTIDEVINEISEVLREGDLILDLPLNI